MKLYLRPKGENGLPLHPTANVEECMKSYDKIVGELYTEEEVLKLLLNLPTFENNLHKDQLINKWFAENKK